ncbi:AraC family transcriptional regulator [Cytophagaceae bacterium DM2B3-1]|uniref:AraC family transcriptional regulator n=1 Tax=Xanthocytophaga flava TaxID=3048013 RepID=A0ABT7CUA7_9BACT|nr:AraC family transcriptional regulator [Xanthocytophaga flavus]MDJ1497322.1 AraC family transcriptional regulator [Xanthocytophaga flavus]
MKPLLLKLQLSPDHSFSVRTSVVLQTYNRWHFHPEVELVYIEKGRGMIFLGDKIQSFQAGDSILIGKNVPHYWLCDKSDENEQAKALVVHFLEDFWGTSFLELPENRLLKELFIKAGRGMQLTTKESDTFVSYLFQLTEAKEGERLLFLLQVLYKIAVSKNFQLISSTGYTLALSEDETDRLNRVLVYSTTYFKQKISLEEVAALAHISPHAFCRYFKARTRKTYSQFLLELRVGHACKLLAEAKLSVAQVCFESGFNTFANFNKYFKRITGVSPLHYQKAHTQLQYLSK